MTLQNKTCLLLLDHRKLPQTPSLNVLVAIHCYVPNTLMQKETKCKYIEWFSVGKNECMTGKLGCVCRYLEHELVFGDPLDRFQEVGIQRQLVVQFLLTFLLSETTNDLH